MSWGKATLLVLAVLLGQQLLTSYLSPRPRFRSRGLEHKSLHSVYLTVGSDEIEEPCSHDSHGRAIGLGGVTAREAYERSVAHAAELSLHHRHVFLGLTPILMEPDLQLLWGVDAEGDARVLMTAWGRRRYFEADDNGARTYPSLLHRMGSKLSLFGIEEDWRHHETTREIWLTPAPQLLRFCAAARSPTWESAGAASLQLRITQLLGLPPSCTYGDVISLWVRPKDLFRPCCDPEIEDYECQQDFTESSRTFVSEEHVKWMTDRQRQLQQQVLPPVPWTQLGFTYDWGDPEHHVGLSEYVCKAHADVIVHSIHSALEYCTPGVVAV